MSLIVPARKINIILQWNEDLNGGQMAPRPCLRSPDRPVLLFDGAGAARLAVFLGLSAAGPIHLPIPWPNSRRLRILARSHAAPNSPTPEAQGSGRREADARFGGESRAAQQAFLKWRASTGRGRPRLFNSRNTLVEKQISKIPNLFSDVITSA